MNSHKKLYYWIIILVIIVLLFWIYSPKVSTVGIKYLPHTFNQQMIAFVVIGTISFATNNLVLRHILDNNCTETVPPNSILDIRIPGCDFRCLRGKGYSFGEKVDPCILTTLFNWSHTLMYMIGGFLAPDILFLWIIAGFWWEMLEAFEEVDCHDYSDIAYNLIGLGLGITIRKSLENKYK